MRVPNAAAPQARIVVLVAACLLLACGGAGQEESSEDPAVAKPGAPEAVDDWPCEREGYPCTWDEVSAEATERSFALADEALDRFEPGAAEAVVEWLAAQPGVVQSEEEDRTMVWFRLAEGRPVFVVGPNPPPLSERVPSGSSRTTSDAGGRDVHLASVSGPYARGVKVLSAAIAGMRPAGAPVGVTGRDRNEDGRVNQRDQRQALILEPMDWEFCYEWYEGHYGMGTTPAAKRQVERLKRANAAAIQRICAGEAGPETLTGLENPPTRYRPEGADVQDVLEEMPAYAGHVTRLTDEQVDLSILDRLNEFDVIHWNTHGSRRSIGLGVSIEWSGRGRIRGAAARRRGLAVSVHRGGSQGPQKRTWYADQRYIRRLHPHGLDRTLVYLSSCNGVGPPKPAPAPLADAFLGRESMVVGWGQTVNMTTARTTAVAFYIQLAEGWPGREAIRRIPDVYGEPVFADEPPRREDIAISEEEFRLGIGMEIDEYFDRYGEVGMLGRHEVFGSRGADMRIREVTQLLHPPSPLSPSGYQPPIKDGDDLERLVVGELGDGEDDYLRVTVDVEPIRPEEVGKTRIHLELDGVRIGEPEVLQTGDQVPMEPTHYRHNFVNVPVGKDLQPETEYELEAVVSLPEGGESRYAARLTSDECPVILNGDFEGHLAGQHAQTFERRRGLVPITQAKIFLEGGTLRNPLLVLTQRGARKDSWEFDLGVNLDEIPTAGARMRVEDRRFPFPPEAGVPSPPPRIGGFYHPAGAEEQWQFVRGAVNIMIHRVKWLESGGERTGMACGEVEANLEALVPGVYPFQYVPETARLTFLAEIRGRP